MDATDTPWRKARKSGGSGGGCVELRQHDGMVEVRDSKLGDRSSVLRFDRFEFECFLDGAVKGEFLDLLEGLPVLEGVD